MTESNPPVTRTKIAGEVGTGDWALLAPHAERDALIIIDAQLDLVDAALAIAHDDSAQVQEWITSALVRKPGGEDLTRFNEEPKSYFQFVVIHPFVVAVEIDLEVNKPH